MAVDHLKGVECWIFDLDNTLYPPDAALFPQIHHRMSAFIARELGLPEAEAAALRDAYWREYGTTLSGMVDRHGVCADTFLAQTHDIDYSALAHDAALAAAIDALPGRKIIHTNAPRCHAEACLSALGYGALFGAVYSLENANLVSKPHAQSFHAVWNDACVDPTRAAMIEDDARNLTVPHSASVRTIWLDHGPGAPSHEHVHHRITDLSAFLGAI